VSAGRLAWLCATIGVLLLAGGVALRPDVADTGYILPIAVSFTAVGALLASRRPTNPVGWLFLAFGAAAALDFAALQYAYRGIVDDPASLPGAAVAASLGVHLWHASFGLFVLSLLLFPDGRLVSPRWRWAAVATVIVYAGMAVSGALDWDFVGELAPDLEGAGPLVGGTAGEVAGAAFTLLILLNLVLLVISAASLLVRLRRSSGRLRRQITWFVVPAALVMIAFPITIALVGDGSVGIFLVPVIPVAAAYAILRHRLYDIDLVINRALVYGLLTAVLAAAYLGLVVLLGLALGPLTSESDLAIALSTLTVAALFRPVRRRVQAVVDRRFYRHKYDAQRILEHFGARLRAQTDLDALQEELTGAVRDAMQPAHVSVWLREGGR
jgi:hypothetical protein